MRMLRTSDRRPSLAPAADTLRCDAVPAHDVESQSLGFSASSAPNSKSSARGSTTSLSHSSPGLSAEPLTRMRVTFGAHPACRELAELLRDARLDGGIGRHRASSRLRSGAEAGRAVGRVALSNSVCVLAR